jgi:hypothetical protein
MKRQWVVQIDVTNACNRACSNCTRLIGHTDETFYMDPDYFRHTVKCLRRFPTHSPPSLYVDVPNKMLGMIGGEPLMHPQFEELAKIMEEEIPCREHRGLWTGFVWQRTRFAELIERVFGYVNNNTHSTECYHSPILVAIKDVVPDEATRKSLISNCWLQKMWAGTVTPKGLFFCEVAGAFDFVMKGPGGLPVTEDCWERPLSDFQEQIDRWCQGCGVPLQLKGRRDTEEVDDISLSNLALLSESSRIKVRKYNLVTGLQERTGKPWEYLK